MRFTFLFVLIGLLLGAAARGKESGPKTYPAQGVIEKIDAGHHQLTIHHHAIPGYMMEMTMDFPVRNDAELKGLSIGDQINFNLVVDSTSAYVQDLHRTGHTDQPAARALPMGTPPENPARLQPGDPFPPVELLAESGRVIHLADFRGKAVALTFFFTRCPLPNYCPLMNRNFAATRQLLRTAPGAPRNWQLLSISFDAGFDTPSTLMSYASFFRGNDAAGWLFASARPDTLSQLAPRIGLMIMGQEASLTHNLRTLIIDPQGHLYRQFNDNLWTPQQLADALIAAARLPAK